MRGAVLSLLGATACGVYGLATPQSPSGAQRDYAAKLAPAALATPAAPVSTPPLRVRIWADEDFRNMTLRWEERVRALVQRSSNALAAECGGTLEVTEIRPWARRSNLDPALEGPLRELQDLDRADDVDFVVGFVTPLPVVTDNFHHIGLARKFGQHFVQRGMEDPAERLAMGKGLTALSTKELDELYSQRRAHREAVVFLHELGHLFGAVHSIDGISFMYSGWGPREAAYGPLARDIMRSGVHYRPLVADEPDLEVKWIGEVLEAVRGKGALVVDAGELDHEISAVGPRLCGSSVVHARAPLGPIPGRRCDRSPGVRYRIPPRPGGSGHARAM